MFGNYPGGFELFVDKWGKDATLGFEAENHSEGHKKEMKQYLIGNLEKSDSDGTAAPGAQLHAGKEVSLLSYT